MISKFFNFSNKIEKYVDRKNFNKKYLNFINENSLISSYNSFATLADGVDDIVTENGDLLFLNEINFINNTLPENILNPSITDELTTSNKGLVLDLFPGSVITGQESYNGIIFQFNKFDKDLIDNYYNEQIIVELIDKTDFSTYKKVVFNNSIEEDTLVGNVYTTKKFNIDMGIILIEQEILSQLGLASIDSQDYLIAIHYTGAGNFSVSNVCVTNSFDFYFTTDLKPGRENRRTDSFSKRSGKTRVEKNDYSNTWEAGIDVLTPEQLQELDTHIIKNNIYTPCYMFPYCEASKDQGLTLEEARENYIYNIRNLEYGVLYLLRGDQDVTHNNPDIFSLDLKLIEYK